MNLPPEILSLICDLISKRTLKCARMACKALEQAASPFLFDEVFMSSTYLDIEVANHITTHFAQHIKTITVSFRHFPEHTKCIFAKRRQHEQSGWSRECFEDHKKHALGTYHKARADNIEIIGSGELLAQLCRFMMMLPSLRKLALTDRGCGSAYETDNVYFRNLWQRGDLCPFDVCALSRIDHARFYIGPKSGYGYEDPNPWHLIMLALSIADPPITEIVSMFTESTCLIPMGSFAMTPRQAQDVAMRFKVLTKLRLSLRDEDTLQNEGNYNYISDNSVARALSAAVNLKSLFIENDGDIRSTADMWSFGSVILEGCRFPELRSLILVNIDADEEKLLNLLGASPRLENLFLCSFALYGSWASAAARLKLILQLKNVEITNLSDESPPSLLPDHQDGFNSDHRLIEDFFLREGENPFTEQAIKDFYDNNDEERRLEINKGIGDYENHFEMYH